MSDDYGLASQVAWYERHRPTGNGHRRGPTLVLSGDGIYHRSAELLEATSDPGPLLLLAVQVPVDSLDRRIRRMTPIRALRHPLTGGTLELAGGRRASTLPAANP